MKPYKWALWAPSRDLPAGLVLGAHTGQFEKVLAGLIAEFGPPTRVTEKR
ncbi:MAG: hypothetical protein QOE90_1482 [Thermoplasmata archaeon]|jgi:hypothetical protein|nr:hypothetical protein [Thermoplasmata archaeon]